MLSQVSRSTANCVVQSLFLITAFSSINRKLTSFVGISVYNFITAFTYIIACYNKLAGATLCTPMQSNRIGSFNCCFYLMYIWDFVWLQFHIDFEPLGRMHMGKDNDGVEFVVVLMCTAVDGNSDRTRP